MNGFSEKDAATIVQQLLRAMSCCHSHKLKYLEFNPIHINFDRDTEDDKIKLKLTEFATSIEYDDIRDQLKEVGYAYYLAPEVVMAMERRD